VTVCLSLFIPIHRLTILSPLAIAGGLYFLFLGFHLLAHKRRILATPTSRISSAAKGAVEIGGEAAGPYTLSAPITGKPCFLYRATVWQQRKGQNTEWERIADETLHMPFFVANATGQLLIEPLGADLDLPSDFSAEYDAAVSSSDFVSSKPGELPPRISAFLSRHSIVPSRRLRIEEMSIKPQDMLFVTGILSENPGVQVRPFIPHHVISHNASANRSSEHVAAPQIINLSSGAAPTSTREMSQQAKIAAALNRAGITKLEAWSAAGLPFQNVAVEENAPPPPSSAANEKRPDYARDYTHLVEPGSTETRSDGDHANSDNFDHTPPVVLMKGASDQIFTISFRSQKEFVSALAWKSAAMIWGGSAITLLGFYALLRQMRMP
jgi:hypothetical protein